MFPIPTSELDIRAEHAADGNAAPLTTKPLIDQLRKGWSSVALGIILAGGLYPIVLAILGVAIGVILNRPSIPELVAGTFFLLVYTFIAGLVGLVWTNVVVVVTLPAVLLVAWSLSLRGSIIGCGAFWGGLVGFVAVVPFMFMVPFGDNLVISLAMGPVLTTVLGQLGGAWGGRRALQRIGWYERAIREASTELQCDDFARAGEQLEIGDTQARFQFGIRHLLWTVVWLSLLLSLIRLLGIPFDIAMPMLVGWVVFQAGTLWVGGWLLRSMGPRGEATRADVPRGTIGRVDAACAFHVEHTERGSALEAPTGEVVSRETE
jgi:hypothetical protein